METKQFQNLLESIINLSEDHMKGKTVIVNGKRGVVGKEVSKDGETENDEVYRVKFEDGTVKDIPARDMEIAGDTKNKKQPSENEAEDIANESVELDEAGDPRIGKMSRKAQEILANMANSLDTTGGPYLDKKNVKFLTRRGVENTLKSAQRIPKGNKNAWKDIALIKKELGESVELDELSNKTLAHYLVKASKSLDDGSAKHKGKRAKGMMKALKKRPFANISKKESVELDEVGYMRYRPRISGEFRTGPTKAKQNQLKRRNINPKKLGTGHAIVPDTIQGKPNPKQTKESVELDELKKSTLRSYATKARTQITKDLYTDFGKHKPSTNRRAKGLVKAKERLGEGSLGYQKALRSKGKEKEGVRSGNKREKAMDFRRWDAERQKNKKAHGTNEDYQCPKEVQKQNMKGVGIGIPAINNKKWGTGGLTNGGSDTAIGSPVGNPDAVKKARKAMKEDMSKYDSYDKWRAAGFPTKQKKKKPMVKVKTNREIGWEMRDGATGKVIKKGGPPVSKK